MTKYEEFAEQHDGEPPFKVAAKYLGLQSLIDEQRVWVLSKSLQFNSNGEQLLLNSSHYVWLGDFAARCKGLSSNAIVDSALAAKVIVNTDLSGKRALKNLVEQLKVTYEENYPAAVLTMGAQIMSVHYEILVNDGGYNVPATLLHGEVSHGKSLATKAALSMLGIQENYFLSGISDTKTVQLTSTTTLGLVIDDPSDVKAISEKIMYFYDSGKQSKCAATFSPRCTFLSSVNNELLSKLTALPDR